MNHSYKILSKKHNLHISKLTVFLSVDFQVVI